MTNEEKYKTIEERSEAFQCFCKGAGGCASCAISNALPSYRCLFEWLALEVEKERPLPCPCCGGRASVTVGFDWAQVKCQVCRLETELEGTEAKAIAVWNRRAK